MVGRGALEMFDEQPAQADINNVDSRKEAFNRATQRILQARNSLQQPYGGSDLGNLALGASLGKASGLPVAEGFTGGMLDRALMQQKQQEAVQGFDQQRMGLDARADIARILGEGGSLDDASMLGALSGDDKLADSLTKQQLYSTRATTGQGATVTAARALMAADPTLDFPTAFSIAKSGLGQGNTITGGQVKPIGGSIETGEKRKYTEKSAEKQAEIDVAKLAEFPQATSSYYSTMAKSKNVLSKIDEAIPQVGTFTTGFFGKKLTDYAGTPAADLAANLDTVRANIGFDELQNMRDNSPTGGALGQVAVREIDFLQSVWDNVQQSQSPSQLKSNLEKLRKSKIESNERIKKAFEREFSPYVDKEKIDEAVGNGDPASPPPEAKQAKDGKYYIPDPQRPGKFLKWQP